MNIVRCISCDGFGWFIDEFTDETSTCDWCNGVGYVYRDEHGADHVIPDTDYSTVAETLEELEQERLQEMGYTGVSKKPWHQQIRQGRNLLNNDDESVL